MVNGKAVFALGSSALALAGCMVAGRGFVMSTASPTPRPQFTTSPLPEPAAIAGPVGMPGRVRGPVFGGAAGPVTPDAAESPLPIGGAVKPLEPAPPLLANETDAVSFGNGSPFYVWRDDSGDSLMAAEVGGAIRRLGAWNRGPYWPRFADGGRHLLVQDYARRPAGGDLSGIARRHVIYPLAGGSPIVAAEDTAGTHYDPLPDGSGLSRLAVTEAAAGPPSDYRPTPSPVSAPARSDLVIRAPGGPDTVAASLASVRHGVWSLDARFYASIGYRQSDPLQGMDLVVLDRATKASRLLYHLETDYFWPAQEGNFRWTPDNRVAFAHLLQHGASASVAITSIPADSRPAEISLFPLELQPGESGGSPLMAADARALAFTVLRSTIVKGEDWQATYPVSHGVWVCTVADGRVRRLTERGRPVAWLPDGRTLICATGRGRYIRYYLVDTAEQVGGAR